MAIEDRIFSDLAPGMKLTIAGAAARYQVHYSTAQKALRKLWRQKFLKRHMRIGGRLEYEGKQERLV